jgi:hypothetical protein
LKRTHPRRMVRPETGKRGSLPRNLGKRLTMPRTPRIPRCRLHKLSGSAVVTLSDGLGGRRDIPLGEYDSLASWDEYHRIIPVWKSGAALGKGEPGPRADYLRNAAPLLAMG